MTIETRDPLAQFMYLLMRDHLPSGKVESIMNQVREISQQGFTAQFSAPHLAAYACQLTNEMRDIELRAAELIAAGKKKTAGP